MEYSSERDNMIWLLIEIRYDDPELVNDLMMQLPKYIDVLQILHYAAMKHVQIRSRGMDTQNGPSLSCNTTSIL